MNRDSPDPTATIEYSDPAQLVSAPVISVVMLVYNHRYNLGEAIESVIMQDHGFPIELLIGEDCSTDGSNELVHDYRRRYPQTIRVVTAECNVGAYRNCMRLFSMARGEFIAQLDGDDYWLPGKLSEQVALLRARNEAVAVYANALALNQDGVLVGQFNDVGYAEFDLAAILRRGNFLNTSTMMFRSSLISALQGIGHEFIDFQTHLTIARHGNVLHVARPLAAYRTRSAGSMLGNDNARVRELYWQAIQSVPRELVSDNDYAHGLADFLRRVFFRAVRTRSRALWREWEPRVFAAAPYGASRMYLLTAANILRMAAKETIGLFRRDARGHRFRVLYRR